MTFIHVNHPSVFMAEEMDARQWSRDDLAMRMGTREEFGVNRLSIDFYFEIGPENPELRIGKDGAESYGRAFDVEPQFFLNLEARWLDYVIEAASAGREVRKAQ